MNIINVCDVLYPGQVSSGNIQFRQEWPESIIEIIKWEVPGVDQPTEQSLIDQIPGLQAAFEFEEKKRQVRLYLDKLMVDKSAEKHYSSGYSCASYVSSTNPLWKAEADAFVLWRDLVFEYAYDYQDRVESGEIVDPDLQAFIAGLPVLIWPTLEV